MKPEEHFATNLMVNQQLGKAVSTDGRTRLDLWAIRPDHLEHLKSSNLKLCQICIAPMNAERFLVFLPDRESVEMRDWEQGSVQKEWKVEFDDRYEREILWCPLRGKILLGGGWSALYWLDPETGEMEPAHAPEGRGRYLGYLRGLAVSPDEHWVIHANNDQFSEVGLWEADPTDGLLRFRQELGGDLRCHEDVVKFLPGGSGFIHIWMDYYRKHQIDLWALTATGAIKNWNFNEQLVFFDHTDSRPWRSALTFQDGKIIIGAGQTALVFRTDGTLLRKTGLPWIVNDLAPADPAGEQFVLATDAGMKIVSKSILEG